MLSEHEFTIKYGGNQHEIDARTLLPSLLAFVSALEEINKDLEPSQKLDIKIQANSPGSFRVIIALYWKEIVGLFQSGTPIPVLYTIFKESLSLKKILGGQQPEKIEVIGDRSFITTGNGNTYNFDHRTTNILLGNPRFDASLADGFSYIDADNAIDSLKLYSSSEVNPDFVADKEEISEMKEPIQQTPENTRTILEEKARLTVIRPDFSGKLKWDLIFRGNRITAWVVGDFRDRATKGESFQAGDELEADLEIVQIFDSAFNAFLNKGFRVVKVHSHIPAEGQLPLGGAIPPAKGEIGI